MSHFAHNLFVFIMHIGHILGLTETKLRWACEGFARRIRDTCNDYQIVCEIFVA